MSRDTWWEDKKRRDDHDGSQSNLMGGLRGREPNYVWAALMFVTCFVWPRNGNGSELRAKMNENLITSGHWTPVDEGRG